MLSKRYRLKKNSEFTATYKVRNSFYRGGVAVFVAYKKENSETPTKVGFVVSKKTHKRAVKRNRLKRLMRESYRLLLKEGKTYKSNDYKFLIFVGHEKALGRAFFEVKKNIEHLLEQIDA